MADLRRLAELENSRWHRSVAVSSPAGTVAEDASTADKPTGQALAYRPLDGGPGPAVADRMHDFEYVESVAVGSVLIVRFRWAPDGSGEEYLLVIPFRDPDDVDLDGGGVEVFEQIMFRVVHSRDWQRSTVRVDEHTSMLLPGREAG